MNWKEENDSGNVPHSAIFPYSAYENPELLPVIGRAIIISGLVTVILSYAAGYVLSTYHDSPWAQEMLSFVLGLSSAFVTRFDDLQSLTQTGGYYYVGSLVVASVATVVLSLVLLGTYLRITFWSEYAAPFNPKTIKGVGLGIILAAMAVYVCFFMEMNTGPYLGMSRYFFPQVFPLLAYGVPFFTALAVCQLVIFVMKYVFLRKGRGNV